MAKRMQRGIEAMRRDGVVLAETQEGFCLPVLDVTHPRFAVPEDPASLKALYEQLRQSERERRRIPKVLMRLMLRLAARRSRLVRAMFGTDAAFLDGISTHVMKLGDGNLAPPFDTRIDRRFVAAPHATFMRLRTQQMATLLAEGLARELQDAGRRPLHLLNIAGGPAIDSLNALILVAGAAPELLRRPITLHVLDLDEAGAVFGRNALAAMQAPGHRLHGLAIASEYRPYDWNEPRALASLLDELSREDAVVVASSEGGLFEYGSDAAIVANLKAMGRDGGARLVVGSVTRDDRERRRLLGASRFKVIPRGTAGFAPLAARAGFRIEQVRSVVWSDQVRLRPE